MGQDDRVSSDDLLASLLAALEVRPDDDTLRLHIAGVMVSSGRAAAALGHVSQVLASSPGNPEALALLRVIGSQEMSADRG